MFISHKVLIDFICSTKILINYKNMMNSSYLQNGLEIEKLGHSFDKLVFVKRILLINLTLEPALPDIIFAIDKS